MDQDQIQHLEEDKQRLSAHLRNVHYELGPAINRLNALIQLKNAASNQELEQMDWDGMLEKNIISTYEQAQALWETINISAPEPTGLVYWVDRFDHILPEEAYSHAGLISYMDAKGDKYAEYLQIEQQLIAFLMELLTDQCPATSVKCKAAPRSAGADQGTEEAWKLRLLYQISSGFTEEHEVRSEEELKYLLQLGLREYFHTRFYANGLVVEIGFDLKMYVQFIGEAQLRSLTDKHGLHILRSDYPSIWES